MLEKLRSIEAQFRELELRSTDPAVCSDGQAYTALMKEYRRLAPVAEKFREWQRVSVELEEAKALADTADEADIRELAEAEWKSCTETLKALEQELKVLLIPRDPNDDRNVMVEIRAGAGGEEAALFAAVLYRMYGMYADPAGFRSFSPNGRSAPPPALLDQCACR